MADGGAEPWDQDEHLEDQDPAAPQPPMPSPGHGRALLLAEDITARKRPRLCPGSQASPSHHRGPESPWEPGGAEGGWGPRAGRVTGLYAQLLRELEAEVGELQRALAARDEAVLRRDRRIRQLELENRQLRSQVRSLEEENDLLSSRGGCGGPLAAAAATATRTLLAAGNGSIGEREAQTGAGSQLGGLHHPPAAGRPLAGLHQQAQAHDPAAARLFLLTGDAGPVLGHGPTHRPQQHHHGAAPPPACDRGQRHQRVRHQDVRPRLQLQRRHQQQVRHVPAGRQEDGREDEVSRDPRDGHGPPATLGWGGGNEPGALRCCRWGQGGHSPSLQPPRAFRPQLFTTVVGAAPVAPVPGPAPRLAPCRPGKERTLGGTRCTGFASGD
ncbi:uncharacterized protein LOC141970298 isoform X2 [Athene noctua]|uniref:uncharacterized protein LOC141970298 isoform X2 n=1 Tax=Athene noctua TaxID=126797 RepID=UPI003EBAF132